MNLIDPVNPSLYFSAASQVSKETVKQQPKEKAPTGKKLSFAAMLQKSQELDELAAAGLPQEIAGLSAEETVVFLKDAIDIAGDKMLDDMTAESFAAFKKSVGQFMRYVAKNNYEVVKTKRLGFVKKKGVYFSERRARDPLVQVREVDGKLAELATMILQNHADKIRMLSKINEIKGLLVDFFAA